MLPFGELEDVDRQVVVHAERERGRVHHLAGRARSPPGASARAGTSRSGPRAGRRRRRPATPFFAIRIASAPISSARSAAAVSVVKNGLPVPAAKITIRPFSRWRIARRRMYGSATSATVIADRHAGLRVVALERVLHGQRVEHGREHPRVVGGRPVHAGGRRLHAADDVPGADHERDLEPALSGPRRSPARATSIVSGSTP